MIKKRGIGVTGLRQSKMSLILDDGAAGVRAEDAIDVSRLITRIVQLALDITDPMADEVE